MTSYCKSDGCRFSQSHTTSGHKCGKCGEYGHGVMECGNNDRIVKLPNDDHLPQALWCTMLGCSYPWSHASRAHHCSKCGRNHHSRDCIISNAIQHETYRNIHVDLVDYDNVFIVHGIGMGCVNYIRKKNGVVETLFMHSDAWGQYGPDEDDTPIYTKFLENMIELNSIVLVSLNIPHPITGDLPVNMQVSDIIKCPVCRTENEKSEIKKVKGLSDNCSICYDNNVEVYFPKCEHACVCNDCFNKL